MSTTPTLPLRLGSNGSLVTAEQDTDADIESCVVAILSYPKGWRDDDPDFGRPELVFQQGGIDVAALTRDIREQEPRATTEIVARALDSMGVQRVSVDPGSVNG